MLRSVRTHTWYVRAVPLTDRILCIIPSLGILFRGPNSATRGAPTEKSNDDSRKDNEDTIVKEIKITKPKVQFARESYMLRESKPTRTVLANDNSGHSYNLSIKNAIKTHGDIVVKALFTECSSLIGKSTFHPMSRSTLTETEIKSVIRSSCFMKEKATPDGVIAKVKARVVAGGN